MTTKYTPPYHKMPIAYPVQPAKRDDSIKECEIVDTNGVHIGDCDVSHAETIIRAINAAPELLEACKALIRCYVGDRNAQNLIGESGTVADQARAAIARAEGQQ